MTTATNNIMSGKVAALVFIGGAFLLYTAVDVVQFVVNGLSDKLDVNPSSVLWIGLAVAYAVWYGHSSHQDQKRKRLFKS